MSLGVHSGAGVRHSLLNLELLSQIYFVWLRIDWIHRQP
jgi:hypothetical protein